VVFGRRIISPTEILGKGVFGQELDRDLEILEYRTEIRLEGRRRWKKAYPESI